MSRTRVFIADFISQEVHEKELLSETQHFARLIDPGKVGAGRSFKKFSNKYQLFHTREEALAELEKRVNARILSLENELIYWQEKLLTLRA